MSLTRARWDPAQHPRGPLGRFIDTSGSSPGWDDRGRDTDYRGELVGGGADYGDEQMDALEQYIDSSGEINLALRDRDPEALEYMQEWLGTLDSAIEVDQIGPDGARVYRGVDVGDAWAGLQPGDQIHDRGYMSTSGDRSKAAEFGETLMELDLPPGTHVAAPYFGDGESEYLVGRGSVIEVVEIAGSTIRARLVGYLED